ncbi:MAG: RNA polymerase subunit sigma-24 [Crocinitomicaceae bacterium]|nr:RNA polymerase subunit sigma-24 [Crocinitomicaceae bacterium]|tara:strand:+ start:383 stop:922 length:540 start_codon:yes stop_codon:yes gene_type:complete
MKQQSILNAVKQHSKKLFSFIRSKVQTDEDAEDILQDVWYSLSTIVDTESIEQLDSWLYRISRNKIIDRSRKKTTKNLEDLAIEDEAGEQFFPNDLLKDNTLPDLGLEQSFIQEALMAAIDELPPQQRLVFVLNELEDYTLQEIAEQTGENLKTIISRKQYAMKKLREKLQHIYNTLND